MAAALGAMAYGLSRWNSHTNLKLVIPVFSAGMFMGCMFFHGELVRRKPAPRYLTSFYLMLSIGGAIGGLLVGLAAPRFLTGYFELPLALIACSVPTGALCPGLPDLAPHPGRKLRDSHRGGMGRRHLPVFIQGVLPRHGAEFLRRPAGPGVRPWHDGRGPHARSRDRGPRHAVYGAGAEAGTHHVL